MTKSEENDLKRNYIRAELAVVVLSAIHNFKSSDNIDYKITDRDIIQVLSGIIHRKTT